MLLYPMPTIGLSHTSTLTVDPTDTATAQGSGNLPVLATPRMVALMENAAMTAVASSLDENETTVGGHINTSHLCPTAIGATITATAVLTAVEGRKLTFSVEAHDAEGRLLGNGTHVRFVVDKTKFMGKLTSH